MSLKCTDILGYGYTVTDAKIPGATPSPTNLTDGTDNGSYSKSSAQMNCRFNVVSNLTHNTNE
jgi:hypothetical protein